VAEERIEKLMGFAASAEELKNMRQVLANHFGKK
jgi:hypothetical protein